MNQPNGYNNNSNEGSGLIPPIIHYIWLGGKPLPDFAHQYIESWRKHCPGWQIIEWNDDALREVNNHYVTQAIERKNWAFASDYLRLLVLKKHGGFYCDIDWEMRQSIEPLRQHSFVLGSEEERKTYIPLTAFIGATPGHPLIDALMEDYNQREFIINDEDDITPNTQTFKRVMEAQWGLPKTWDIESTVQLAQGCVLFPYTHFCTRVEGKENYGIHHFIASWVAPCRRRKVWGCGRYKIVRFIRSLGYEKDDWIQLREDEEPVCTWRFTARRAYALIRSKGK